jgi:hypothetical protein
MYNAHSLPVRGEDAPQPIYRILNGNRFSVGDRGGSTPTLRFAYDNYVTHVDVARQVLQPEFPFELIFARHDLTDTWTAPFFLTDRRRAFYVTSTQQQVLIPEYLDYGVIAATALTPDVKISGVVLQKYVKSELRPKFWGDGGPRPDGGLTDPMPMRQFVTEDAYIHQGLASTAPVMFGDQRIGPAGAIQTPADR